MSRENPLREVAMCGQGQAKKVRGRTHLGQAAATGLKHRYLNIFHTLHPSSDNSSHEKISRKHRLLIG